MGAWIEIRPTLPKPAQMSVAPFVGAWIEIQSTATSFEVLSVAPFVGAWIEINDVPFSRMLSRRTLCGCVD